MKNIYLGSAHFLNWRRLIAVFLFVLGTQAKAQVGTYTFTQSTGVYTPITGTLIAAATDPNPGGTPESAPMDDYTFTANALPFTFNFNGTAYTSYEINTNGWISFGGATTSTSTPISTLIGSGVISPFANDMMGITNTSGIVTSGSNVVTSVVNTSFAKIGAPFRSGTNFPSGTTITGFTANTITVSNNATGGSASAATISWASGEIRTDIQGVAPNRTFIIQFSDFAEYTTSGTGTAANTNVNFQIHLSEGGNIPANQTISVVYGNVYRPAGSETAQVGLRGTATSDYNNRTTTTDWSATTAGTASNASATWNSTSFPANGLIYTWTPPAACSGTPVAGVLNIATQNVCTGTAPATLVASGYTTGVSGLTFQWQESDDDGISDPWANATGGSGATTASYTPPSFSGNMIYYRLLVACSAGGGSDVTASSVVAPVTAPATPASAVSFTNVSSNGFTVNWTNGDGGRRYVVVSDANSFTDPVDGTTGPTVVGTAYAGTGEQIVYDGTGSSVTVTGLSCNGTYYARVYEYKRCGTSPSFTYYFNTSISGTNPVSQVASLASAALPVVNDFTGFTGSNLSVAVPGWNEGKVATTAGSVPSHSNPSFIDGSWRSSSAFTGVTTAAVNLYTDTRNEWIISPLMNLTVASRLKFKTAITNYNSNAADPAGMQGTDDSVHVLISTDGCGAAWTSLFTFSASNTTALTNTLTDFNIPLNAYTGQTVQIAFQATDGPVNDAPDYDFHIGNIIIEPAPQCDVPTALTAGNVLMNSAELGWTENGGATLWSVEYGPQGFTPGTGTYVSGTAANPYTATGLAANTFYDFYVRSVCSASDSSALAGPFTFVTKQVPVSTFPWTEDWETGGTEWTIMNGTQVNKWSVGTATDNGGAQSLYISNDNGTSNAYTLGTTAVVQAFRDIAVPSGMPAISLSFDWKADGEGTLSTTSYDYFRVWLVPVSYLPTPGTQITAAGSGGIQLGGNLLDQASFTAANLVIPGSYAGTTFRLVFEWRNDGGSGAQPPAAIDNVQMIVGSCPQPASLTVVNPAANSADLGWTEAGTASLWQIEYAATGFTQGSGTLQMAGTNPYPLSGLSPNTTYDFYVRSVCSPGDSSDWTGPFTFATACLPVTSLPWTETFESSSATKNCWKVVNANNDGDQWSLNGTGYPFTGTVHAQMYTDGNGGANDDWLITPAITLSGNQQLRYWYRARSASEPNDYTVLLSTTGFAPGDFTNTLLPLTSVSNIAYAQNTINLSTYTGTVYIAFRVPPGGLDGWYLFLDDVTVEDIPTCFNPTGLGTANATTGGADINWTASASGPTSGYDYYVDTSSLPPAAGVTPAGSVGAGVLTATLSGYAPATTYYVWVRANCGSGDVSSWEGPASFTTLCPVSFTPNYSQDFSAYIPSCWAEQEGALTASATLTGTTSAWLSDSWMNSTTSNGQAARINLFNTGDRDWLVTPSIDLGTAGNYYLQFNVAFLDYGTVNGLSLGSDDTLAVVISTDNGATWSLTNVLQTWTAANSSFTSQYITIPLTAYTGIVKFGFYGSEGVVDDPNDVDVMIDNFLVTNTPLAIRLTNIYAANDGSRNRVNWITSEEAKGDYFIVERSADGRNYTALGTVGAKGKPSAYIYWDETPVEGINYYRLRMSDASGSFEYSKVVTAAVKGHGTFSVDAYPNPVREILTVRINGVLAGDAAITVTDIAGKVVRTVIPGSNIVTLDMKDMAKGVYIVRYSDADHSQVIKVNKQ